MTRVVAAADIAPTPWKNGGGVQRDLVRQPDGEAWRVRVSLADIDRDGPFSQFPGTTRHFAIVDGAGVALAFADGLRQVGPNDPALTFDGADAPVCKLADGPTRALNLMTRGVRARLARAVPGAAFAGRPLGVFACGRGQCSVDHGVVQLAPASLAWFDQPSDRSALTSSGWWIVVEDEAR